MNTQMVGYLPKKTSISDNVVSILGFPQSQSLYVVLYLFLYIFIVYIYYPTVVPWSSLGNRKPQLPPGGWRLRKLLPASLCTWLVECWGIIPSINGFVTFCNYGYEPLKWGTLQLYFWHSQCFSSRSWQSWAEFQHPVTIPSHPPTETPILHNVCSISKLTQSYAAFYKPLRNVHGNLEWAPSFRPQPSPADVDEAKALSKTGDEVHHGRWE